ncbi:FAD-dependent oxidoreductase [Amycolatopsis keratiniphila]|uniref:NAD(P)/FAD-dependent oxidoreductase n=1 Tax=Amycolatopsis keratiniphila TaxID=129921 RepID=UPI0033F41B3C
MNAPFLPNPDLPSGDSGMLQPPRANSTPALDSASPIARNFSPDMTLPSVPKLRPSGPLAGVPVAIVGAGPVGSWTAALFGHAGAAVRLYDDGILNTGFVNAGWGFAYHSSDPAAGPLAAQGIELYRRLAGTVLPRGVVTEEWSTVQRARNAEPLPAGLAGLPGYRLLELEELYRDMIEGVIVKSVVVPGQLLLPALADLHQQYGVRRIHQHVPDPAALTDAAFVVNSTGLASAWLFEDTEFSPSMGTVVRLQKPEGFTGVHAWDNGTNTAPYAISQEATGQVVVGGTTTPVSVAQARRWVEAGSQPDEETGERVLEQIKSYLPELSEAEFVRTDTGIRPERRRILLARHHGDTTVFHATGFGGFGVTVAPAVALRLVEAAIAAVAT